MSTRLDVGVELLERSLAYTRVALSEVRPTTLTRPTPCSRWDLAALLAHMDDALDAFLEAAGGSVAVARAAPGRVDVAGLRDKACALLGTWSAPARTRVAVGGVDVDAAVLVGAAAVEITVHGWDVATTLGLDHPVPSGLATDLLPVALDMAALGDFAPPVRVPGSATPGAFLLATLGRSTA